MTIHNWSARRSGGRITIHGEHREPFADGSIRRSQVKVTRIDAIMVEGQRLVAVDADEVEYDLATGWSE
jgi:hypothetical protein